MTFRSSCCCLTKALKQNQWRYKHLEQNIRVFEKEINIVRAGDGEKTLLLMPGALGTAWTDFRPQIEKLPSMLPEHTVFAWDPPGCGKSISLSSQPSSINMLENQAHCAIDLMQALYRDSFSILGWNTGGMSALILAGRFPQFVDKLVVWGSSAYLSLHEIKKLDDVRGVNSRKRTDDLGEALRKFYGENHFAKLWPKYLSAMAKIIFEQRGNICKTEVGFIQAPTLILHGSQDPVIKSEHVDFLLRNITNSRLFEFPFSSHGLHLDNANQFNKHVSKFLLEKP